jgi:hypothetical protein
MTGTDQGHADAAAVAPLKFKGSQAFPDMFNHPPARLVSRAEAMSRSWPYFFAGDECSRGHIAARFTKSPRTCVACLREKKGQRPLNGGRPPHSAPLAGNSVGPGYAAASPRRETLKWTDKARAQLLWLICSYETSGRAGPDDDWSMACAWAAQYIGCSALTLFDEVSRNQRLSRECLEARAMGAERTAHGYALVDLEDSENPRPMETAGDPLNAEQLAKAHKIIELFNAAHDRRQKRHGSINRHAIASDGELTTET